MEEAAVERPNWNEARNAAVAAGLDMIVLALMASQATVSWVATIATLVVAALEVVLVLRAIQAWKRYVDQSIEYKFRSCGRKA